MARAVALTVLVAALLLPATAGAARVPLPPVYTVHAAQCPDDDSALGCANPATGDVYITDGARVTRWHELGHVFDYQVLTDRDRAWLTAQLRFPAGTEWMPDTPTEQGSPPGEVFADAYAMCALGRSPAGRVGRRGQLVLDWDDGYGYLPTVRQHRRVCNGIAVIGLAAAAQR